MKIGWIADFSIKQNIGGAQRSDSIILDKGRSQGLDIIEINHDSYFYLSGISKLKDSFDIIVTANLFSISYSEYFKDFFQQIIEFPRHYRLEHDLNSYLDKETRKKLFGSCTKTFLLSEYHHNLFKNMYGDIFKNVVIIPDPIDTNIFRDHGIERKNACLYVGFMHEFKGTKRFLDFVLDHPDKRFVVAAWGDKVYEHCCKTIPNIYYLGIVDYFQMPSLYNQCLEFFYTPIVEEPFCRAAAEAFLCNMKITCNEKIGCFHEVKRLGAEQFANNCKNAADLFWKEVSD